MAKNKFYRIFINGEVTDNVYYDYNEALKAKNEEYPKGVVRKFTSEDELKKELEKSPKHPKCIELENQPSKREFIANAKLRAEYLEKIAKQVEEDETNGYTVIFTDGSNNEISEDEAIPSYGAIIYASEEQEIKGVITDDKYRKQNNYTGEVIAVLKALELCEEQNIKKPSFFVDSTNTLKEFYGCFGKLEDRKNLSPLTILFNEKINEYKEKGLDMKFSWCPGHIDVPQNEAADDLAREAFDEYMATNR